MPMQLLLAAVWGRQDQGQVQERGGRRRHNVAVILLLLLLPNNDSMEGRGGRGKETTQEQVRIRWITSGQGCQGQQGREGQ